jgi:hypothetical protein
MADILVKRGNLPASGRETRFSRGQAGLVGERAITTGIIAVDEEDGRGREVFFRNNPGTRLAVRQTEQGAPPRRLASVFARSKMSGEVFAQT